MEIRRSLRRYEDLVEGCLAVAEDLNKEVSSLSQAVSDVRVALANVTVLGETIDNATVETTMSTSCANPAMEDGRASWNNGAEGLLEPTKVKAIMTEPAIGNPRMPRMTTVVFLICATGLVFGLGLTFEGHEWHQQPAGFQPGIFLIVSAILVAIFTSLIHAAFCRGWRNRSRSVTSLLTNGDGTLTRMPPVTNAKRNANGSDPISGPEPLSAALQAKGGEARVTTC